jgi:hypothetical protein
VISSNILANKIGMEQKFSHQIERKTENNQGADFLSQWIFFAVVALIPNIISFFIAVKKGDTFMTFFKDHRILYVSSTLALVLLIDQIQRSKFENKHFPYLLIIFIGFAFYILLDNGVRFGLFSEIIDFAYLNFSYFIFVLLFGFFGVIQKISYFIPTFRRK